jgi:hypothetical protein
MSVRLIRNTCFQLPNRKLVLAREYRLNSGGIDDLWRVQVIYHRAEMVWFTHTVEILLQFSVHLLLIVVGQISTGVV